LTPINSYRIALGHRFSDDGSEKAHGLLKEFISHLGKPLIGEHVRCLCWLDLLTKKRIRKTAEGLDSFLENTIEEHVKAPRDDLRDDKYRDQREGSDFVGVLLNIQEKDEELGISLSRNNIKAIILVCSLLYRSHFNIHLFQKAVKITDANSMIFFLAQLIFLCTYQLNSLELQIYCTLIYSR
jgi:hypothetical protein